MCIWSGVWNWKYNIHAVHVYMYMYLWSGVWKYNIHAVHVYMYLGFGNTIYVCTCTCTCVYPLFLYIRIISRYNLTWKTCHPFTGYLNYTQILTKRDLLLHINVPLKHYLNFAPRVLQLPYAGKCLRWNIFMNFANCTLLMKIKSRRYGRGSK